MSDLLFQEDNVCKIDYEFSIGVGGVSEAWHHFSSTSDVGAEVPPGNLFWLGCMPVHRSHPPFACSVSPAPATHVLRLFGRLLAQSLLELYMHESSTSVPGSNGPGEGLPNSDVVASCSHRETACSISTSSHFGARVASRDKCNPLLLA